MISFTHLEFKIKMAPPAGAHEAGSGRICCRANDDGPSADHFQDGHWRFGWTTMAFRFRRAGAADLMRWANPPIPILSFAPCLESSRNNPGMPGLLGNLMQPE